MISEITLRAVLERAVAGGADFAEIFLEEEHSNQIRLVGGKIEAVRDLVLTGAGIRAFCGTKTFYSYTNDVTPEGLLACAASVGLAAVTGEVAPTVQVGALQKAPADKILRYPMDVLTREKADVLREAADAARAVSEKISQVQGTYMDVDRHFLVANTEGLFVTDRKIRTRLALNAVASEGGENQSGFYGPGAGRGMEFFETVSPAEVGRRAAKQALTNLGAVYCPAGTMTVAIENGFGGVIFHEACGHSLEATSVAIGASQMAGKLGERIANPKLTAIDDATIEGGWGSYGVDDEGNPAQRIVLIENGVLKNYMIDRLGSRRMGMPMTGSSRRENYTYEPTSRMSNTFIANGPDENEDIIASMEYGLYAKEMGGGSVNPLTGEFNFSVKEGYLVRNGKICEAVRGASLIGTGSEILQDIDMIGKNLATGQGVCGSASGSVPTDVGQPLIRVKKMTVGGR